jgi:hypothetical protein
MNFTFVASKPPDMSFGGLKPDGNWTGMIGEVMNQNADIGTVFLNMYKYKVLRLQTKVLGFSDRYLILASNHEKSH